MSQLQNFIRAQIRPCFAGFEFWLRSEFRNWLSMRKLAFFLAVLLLPLFAQAEGLPLFYWQQREFVNFGDVLSLKLVERMVKAPVKVHHRRNVHEKKLLAIGSILTFASDCDAIWGSGFNGKYLGLSHYHFQHLDVRSVRGPLTRQYFLDHFQIDCPAIYGDPILLFPLLFPEFQKKPNPAHDFLLVLHYADRDLYRKQEDWIVYATDPWYEIIDKVLDSKFVISSSLHGVIIAEAFGIPARYVRLTEAEPLFKFQDYYSGTNRPNFQFARSLEEALRMGGEIPPSCNLNQLYEAFPFEFWKSDYVSTQKSIDESDYTIDLHSSQDLSLCDYINNDPCDLPHSEQTVLNESLTDLEETYGQDFVLETKKIDIPGYPTAFNPSLTRWQGTLLLSFRIYHPLNRTAHRIGLVRLDDDLNLLEEPHILRFKSEDTSFMCKRQDPRLFTVGNRLFIAYNNALDLSNNFDTRRMLVAEVHMDETGFFVDEPEPLLHFEGERLTRSEKNWVPFDSGGQLLFAYSILPHRILQPLPLTGSCKTVASTISALQWDWGVLRGGTPGLNMGDEYLGFFHSSKQCSTIHSKGEKIRHYFMGAYTFSKEPPFAVTRISKEPIVGKQFYHGEEHSTWRPLRVVFPGGFVFDQGHILLAYGRQDHEVWIAKLDQQGLLNSLIPCP